MSINLKLSHAINNSYSLLVYPTFSKDSVAYLGSVASHSRTDALRVEDGLCSEISVQSDRHNFELEIFTSCSSFRRLKTKAAIATSEDSF